MSNNKKFVEFLKREIQTRYPPDEYTATAYKYLSDEEKAKQTFQHATTYGFRLSSSRFGGLSKESQTDTKALIETGQLQLREGIYYTLAKTDPQKASQLFEWAAENCQLSDESVAYEIRTEYFNNIAVGHLWRGYALLNLGEYEEAYELLKQVIPYFNKWKKSGGEVWQKVEYALPKALVPLCEYKLEPTQENLQKAKAGIEEYIKSLQENRDKLEGYLYYFHLKETFADVYTSEKASAVAPLKPKKPAKKLELPSSEYDTKGSVIVFDREGSGSLEVFGTQNEFEAYIEKVKSLGDFPVLSSLMELYATEGLQEPEPLIEECERLLSRADVEPEMKEKTKLILAVAKDAKEADSTVMLYFDPEV